MVASHRLIIQRIRKVSLGEEEKAATKQLCSSLGQRIYHYVLSVEAWLCCRRMRPESLPSRGRKESGLVYLRRELASRTAFSRLQHNLPTTTGPVFATRIFLK